MLRSISQVAADAGLQEDELRHYGPHVAKVSLVALQRRHTEATGRVVLVTSINPTPAGEGKTVTAIALGQALRTLGQRAVVCLRQPSMGPVFGLKGGASGGGRCTIEPADEINLHFTGDFHAVTAATNLLAAVLDDHIYRDRLPRPDVRRSMLHRVLDVNDRALRRVVVGLAGGVPREEQFDITAASEVMAVLGLATDYADLRARLGRMIVGVTRDGTRITADDLRAGGAMAALLRDALQPNLVQTQEGCPAFVHTGPFANIAHGTSSLVSLLLAQRLGRYAIIEAGFGADLGAEKFVHVVGSHGGPHPEVAVVVVTVRALKYHGGVPLEQLVTPQASAVAAGLPQLHHHLAIVRRLHMTPVVGINAFATDGEDELRVIADAARAARVPVAVSRAHAEGGAGARELAELVQAAAETRVPAAGLYTPEMSPEAKLRVVARQVYGAADVTLADAARRHLDEIEAWGYGRLPVCVAKTQYSLSDQAHVRGVPSGFVIHIRDVEARAGAGFILALAGDMMTMPALPPHPRAWDVDLDASGVVRGV